MWELASLTMMQATPIPEPVSLNDAKLMLSAPLIMLNRSRLAVYLKARRSFALPTQQVQSVYGQGTCDSNLEDRNIQGYLPGFDPAGGAEL